MGVIQGAAKGGHVDMLKWALDQLSGGLGGLVGYLVISLCTCAGEGGSVEIGQILLDKMGDEFDVYAAVRESKREIGIFLFVPCDPN